MNKMIKTAALAAIACVALCGSASAAPRRSDTHGQHAVCRTESAPSHRTAPKSVRHGARRKADAARHSARIPAPPPVVARPLPPPPPVVVQPLPPPPPQTVVVHHECDAGTGLGILIGAVVGGIVGAAL